MRSREETNPEMQGRISTARRWAEYLLAVLGGNVIYLAIEPQLRKQLVGARQDFDAALFGIGRIVLPDMIEMGKFGADATEIVPDAGENGLDLRRRFFRERGGQIGAADLLLAHHRSNRASDPAEQVRGLDRIEIAGGAKHSNRQRADRGFGDRLGGVAKTGPGTRKQAAHLQKWLTC